MKKEIILLLFLCFSYLAKAQNVCNQATVTPSDIFYPSSVTNYTSGGGYLYLCGTNTTVYDTTIYVSYGVAFVNANCNFFFCRKGGNLVAYQIFAKNNSTITIKPDNPPNSVVIYYEPLATIINQTGNSLNTFTCASLTFPTVNCIAGIEEIKANNVSVNIWPNPAYDKLNLKIDSKAGNLSNCEFKIYDVQGKLVKTVSLPSSNNSLETVISLNGLYSGTYFYRILTKDQQPLDKGKFIVDAYDEVNIEY